MGALRWPRPGSRDGGSCHDPATTSGARSAAASSGGGWRSTHVGGYAPEARPTSRQHQLQPPKQAAPALHSACSSAKAATAVAIWGAALHAMQCLMHRLREDGETFTPAAAVNAARHRLSAAASADYWWIENQHEWLRDGGARAHPTRTTTRAAWGQKWSGLQRRTPHKVAGHEAADGGATSDGWLHQEEQRACRRNRIA